MSDSANALARSMAGFGQTLGDVGKTVIQLDAKAKQEEAETAIIKEIEDFKRNLLTDPNYGTPEVVSGKREGYIAKYDDLLTGLRSKAEGIDNHLARKAVQGWLEETAAKQETAVTQMQYESWGKDTFASQMKAIRAFNDTTTLSPEERIEHTYSSLDGLLRYNVIDKAKAMEVLGNETSYIMRQDLVEKAKKVYNTDGYEAAVLSITGSKTSVNTALGAFGASDAIKEQAKADLSEYNKLVQEQESSRMEDAWANSVDMVLGRGDKSKPVLTTKMIGESMLDSANREHWVDRLISLDNWMRTGSGAKDLGNVNAFYGSMYQYAQTIRDSMGTARAGEYFQLVLPDGSTRTVTADPRGFEAVMQDMAPVLIKAGKWDEFLKIKDVYAQQKESKGVFASIYDALEAKAKDRKFPQVLLPEIRTAAEAWIHDNPTATAEQVTKWMQTNITDRVVKINTAAAWNYNLKGQQSEEAMGRMIASGQASYYMGSVGNGVYDVQSPLFKDSYRQYKAALEREVHALPTGEADLQIGKNALGRATANGEYWISTEDPTIIEKLGMKGAKSVSYTARLYGQDQTMQRFRQIQLPAPGEYRNQMYLDGIGWISVVEYTAADGSKYWDVPPERMKEIRAREKAASDKAQQQTQEDIWNSWPMGL